MLVRVNPRSKAPLHEQIATELRGAVGRGELATGDRLPPARELAADLGVNMHTVLRAYRQLQDEGLLAVRRGRGVSVCATDSRARLIDLARTLAAEARRQGVSPDELHRLLEEHWS